MPSPRPEKVASLIRQTVALFVPQFFRATKFGLVTVTDVTLTRGLEQATVFVSCTKNKHQFDEEVTKNIHALQQLVNKQIVMRRVPKLVLRLDETGESIARVEELLG